MNLNAELRNGLFLAVVEEPEVLFAEILHRMALSIAYHHSHDDQVALDPQFEWRLIGSGLGPRPRRT